LPCHFLDANFSNMIIIIIWIFGCIDLIVIGFYKVHALHNKSIIPILIELNCLLSNFFYSFDKTIWISVRIEFNDSHSSVSFYNLLPMRHFPWGIILNCFELKRIPIFSLQLITSVLVKISDLFYFYLFIILFYIKIYLEKSVF
jgi:hypothetical protein